MCCYVVITGYLPIQHFLVQQIINNKQRHYFYSRGGYSAKEHTISAAGLVSMVTRWRWNFEIVVMRARKRKKNKLKAVLICFFNGLSLSNKKQYKSPFRFYNSYTEIKTNTAYMFQKSSALLLSENVHGTLLQSLINTFRKVFISGYRLKITL